MKKKTIKIMTIIGIILILLSLSYAIALSYYSAELSRAYWRLEKDRRPMERWQVIPPEVSDSQNAALLYECAASFLKAQPSPDGNFLPYLGDHANKFLKETLDAEEIYKLLKMKPRMTRAEKEAAAAAKKSKAKKES